MKGDELERKKQQAYLGVELTSNLQWTPQVNKVIKKANNTLNVLRRNLGNSPKEVKILAYKSLVRPTLEYAGAVWDPYHKKDIEAIESVQRKAARFVSNDYRRDSSVTAMIKDLNWNLLQERRFVTRMTLLFKSFNNQIAIPVPHYANIATRSVRGQHQYSLYNIRANTDQYKYSYFPRTIRCWNLLPYNLFYCNNADSFQNHLWHHINQGLITIRWPKDLFDRPQLGGSAINSGAALNVY